MFKYIIKRSISFFKYYYVLIFKPSIIKIFDFKCVYDSKIISNNILKFICNNSYEADERVIIKKSLDGTEKVLEVGAGLGFITYSLGSIIKSGEIFSFEANPLLCNLIKENFILNSKDVNIFNGIIKNGSTYDVEKFYLAYEFWSSSTVPLDDFQKVIDVPVIDLNNFIMEHSINTLVLDIEGGEIVFFDSFNFDNINKIIIELHPEKVGSLSIGKLISLFGMKGLHLDLMNSGKRVFSFIR